MIIPVKVVENGINHDGVIPTSERAFETRGPDRESALNGPQKITSGTAGKWKRSKNQWKIQKMHNSVRSFHFKRENNTQHRNSEA